MARLTDNSYGKAAVRITKVVRSGALHEVYEFAVTILLGGAFDAMYTAGDNASCVPTDTMKNTVYALGKKHEFDSIEAFAKILTAHFIDNFSHVAWSSAEIEQTLWARIPVAGQAHDHAFTKASEAKRTCHVRLERGKPAEISGGITNLEVLKTTASGFVGYIKDQYTTLKETTDRIFATSVNATWKYAKPDADFNAAFALAREAILETFATQHSLAVQQTIFDMGETVLARVKDIATIELTMPNQHRLLVNLEPFGMKNANEIFVPTDAPFGLIKGTITRD